MQTFVSLLLSFALPIVFGIFAFKGNEHNAIIFPIFAYAFLQLVGYIFRYAVNPDIFSNMNSQLLIEFIGVGALLAAVILCIIFVAKTKPFAKQNAAAQQTSQMQQPQEQYQPQQSSAMNSGDPDEQLRIAEQRFASGEISITEYEEIRSRLSK